MKPAKQGPYWLKFTLREALEIAYSEQNIIHTPHNHSDDNKEVKKESSLCHTLYLRSKKYISKIFTFLWKPDLSLLCIKCRHSSFTFTAKQLIAGLLYCGTAKWKEGVAPIIAIYEQNIKLHRNSYGFVDFYCLMQTIWDKGRQTWSVFSGLDPFLFIQTSSDSVLHII